MVIEYSELVELLDRSGRPNQGVPASMALVINFGNGVKKHEPISYDTVSDLSIHLDMDEQDRLIGIEVI